MGRAKQLLRIEGGMLLSVAVKHALSSLLDPLIVLIPVVPASLGVGRAELLRDLVLGHPLVNLGEIAFGDLGSAGREQQDEGTQGE